MDRVVKGQPSQITVTLLSADDEQPVDSTTPVTWTSSYSDGSAGPSGTATNISTGVYGAVLLVPIMERLLVTWSATVDDLAYTAVSEVEVVGSRMFTLKELRDSDNAVAGKTTTRLKAARDAVERVFERETGRSFVLAFEREVAQNFRGGELWLSQNEPVEVLTYTVDGTVHEVVATRAEGLNIIDVEPHQFAEQVELSYTYGWRETPVDVKNAALKLARDVILGNNSRMDDRAYALTIPDVGTVNLSTPGERGARTGIPEVDIVLDRYDIRPEGIR